jgi:glycosyltransferase involved in cell wall biosynthesis
MVNTAQTGGGAGRAGQLLAAELRSTGSCVSAFVAGSRGGDPHTFLAGHWRERALSRWLSCRGFPELGHLSSFLWRCRRQYAAADVLHFHNLHGDYLSIAALPLWGFDKPVVWTLHDLWLVTGNCAYPYACPRWKRSCGRCRQLGVYPMSAVDRSRLYRRLKPQLIAAARPILVAPSRWLAAHVRQVPALAGLPLRVIPYPLACDVFSPADDRAEARRYLGLTPTAPTVILGGYNWADARKGGSDAIAALRAASARVPELQLLVIGADSDRVLQRSGVRGRAMPFIRERAALARAYGCADVCLLPSRAENYPLTALEAMACGTPVVAYDVGGVPEQVRPGETGLLARDGQTDELATGLVRVLTDTRAARRMGAAAREFVVGTCSVDAVVERYRHTYAEALHAWRRRRHKPRPAWARGRLARWIARRLGWEADQSVEPAVPNVAADQALLGGVH